MWSVSLPPTSHAAIFVVFLHSTASNIETMKHRHTKAQTQTLKWIDKRIITTQGSERIKSPAHLLIAFLFHINLCAFSQLQDLTHLLGRPEEEYV